MAQLDGLASTGILFGVLGAAFLGIGISEGSAAFWGPGIAALAVAAAAGWQWRRRRAAKR